MNCVASIWQLSYQAGGRIAEYLLRRDTSADS